MSTLTLTDNFAENVRRELQRREMTQRDLARAAGIHYVSICRILTGDTVPSVETCEAIARALDIVPEKIFSEPKKSR